MKSLQVWLSSGLAIGVLLAGCSKETPPAETTPPPNTATPETSPTTPAAATPAAATENLDSRLAASQTAINAREYEKAATALITLQQARLSEQQAEAVAKQMRQLQSSLAGAVASGDPQAKAAAARLRQSTPR